MKPITQKPVGLLQPLQIPNTIWEDVSIDFVTCLPNSHDYTVDHLSKQAHFRALPKSYSAARVAELFPKIICKLYAIPRSIVSDRDPIFLSNFWQELFKLSGTYHPQTDGQSEVVNRKSLKNKIKHYKSLNNNLYFREKKNKMKYFLQMHLDSINIFF